MDENNSFDYRGCGVMLLFLAMNIIVYIYCTYAGGVVYNIGCMDAWRVLFDKEYYRLFTSMFMHGGMDHLVSNMIFLAALGDMLERAIGHLRFGALYLLSGICGGAFSLANVVISGEYYTSVGASGAIFGLIGALFVLVIAHHGHYEGISIKRMLFAVAYMVYTGAASAGIDNAAHVGGLIGGALIMALMYVAEAFRKRRRKIR